MLRLNLVLEEGFSEWWEAYLLYTLEVLKTFRQWGDDEKQLLAIALAENRWGDGAGGLTLSAIALATGMPAETARRNLAQMVGAGHCDRAGDLYRLIVSDNVRVQVEVQARTFARAMQARLAGLGIFVRPPTASEYLASVLRYIANVRRLFGRGSQVASAVAGMVVISGSVHRIMVTEGERRVARAVYNEKVRLLGGM